MELFVTLMLQNVARITFDRVLMILEEFLQTNEQYKLVSEVKKELNKLQSALSAINALLEDAENRDPPSASTKDWLQKLKNIAYDVEDVVDDLHTEALRKNLRGKPRLIFKVHDFFSKHNQLLYRFNLAHRVKRIRHVLESIAEEKSSYYLSGQGPSIRTQQETEGRRETISSVDQSIVYGRDGDRENLVKMLLRYSTNKLSTIAIVGMGGIGKTTLAQLVFNDCELDKFFKDKMWISVGRKFELTSILQSIILHITDKKCDIKELEFLQKDVKEKLSRKRFILVLDNVWNQDPDEWEKIESILTPDIRGSKILVTTRSNKVSSIMHAVHSYNLQPLSYYDCWSLFQRRAFGNEVNSDAKLEVLGKEIVKKCKGLPLAAKALGSFMRFKREESDWIAVLNSEIWQLELEYEDFKLLLPALKLSYDDLRPQLKQCFAFCSIFPKGHEIHKETLINLWMANSLIRGRQDPERVGNDVFNDLLWRCFFQDEKKDADGCITHCMMHDIMHDLARLVAGDEITIMVPEKSESFSESIHHLSVTELASPALIQSSYKEKSLRTFLVLDAWRDLQDPFRIFSEMKFLRALDLSCTGIKELPESLSALKHLRYLNLSNTSIKRLPESTSNLFNLEVLMLGGSRIIKLPKCLRNLQRLRHLNVSGCRLMHMPSGLHKLRELQTLTDFVVGRDKGCSITELAGLDLRGELLMWNLENVKDETNFSQAILSGKKNLHSLRLIWNNQNFCISSHNSSKLLEDLCPHDQLKKLRVDNYKGETFPTWLMNPILANLVELKLVYCRKCKELPPLGKLQNLKYLQIIGMDGLRCITSRLYGSGHTDGFPSLKELALSHMDDLEDWQRSEEVAIFPSLVTLTILSCPKLQIFPRFPCIQRLEIDKSNATLLSSATNLTTLCSLLIFNVPKLTSLPKGSFETFTKLRKLCIVDCHELKSLSMDMTYLTSLENLEITACEKLVSFSIDNQQHNQSLQYLIIRNCVSLLSLQVEWKNLVLLKALHVTGCRRMNFWLNEIWQSLSCIREYHIEVCNNFTNVPKLLRHLNSLHILRIYGSHSLRPPLTNVLSLSTCLTICCCNKLTLLEGIGCAHTLEDLTIENFSSITVLPEKIGDLMSLQYLSIHHCPNLAYLPETFKCLSKLEGLWIEGCPQLNSRCQSDTGEDWDKISHVRKFKTWT